MRINPDVTTHRLKIWPEYFKEVKQRKKKFEIRLDDRRYEKGDVLILKEYNPRTESYTGKQITAVITNTLKDERFLQPGYIALSINVIGGQ